MNGIIDIDSILDKNDTMMNGHECDRFSKAAALLMNAAKMIADASYLLKLDENKNPTIDIYIKLVSEINDEISTLAAAAASLCTECKQLRKTP